MNCVKCGEKTEGTNVFCASCLKEMESYPVKPGTTVWIPPRPETPERKATRHVKEKTAEEQIASLHKLVRFLVICAGVLATTLMIALGLLVYTFTDGMAQETQNPVTPVGRNYSTTGSTDGR